MILRSDTTACNKVRWCDAIPLHGVTFYVDGPLKGPCMLLGVSRVGVGVDCATYIDDYVDEDAYSVIGLAVDDQFNYMEGV